MLKVWIAGASGQIGRALNDVLDPMEIEALNTDLDELDITDTDEVINFGTVNRPDVIINCTGLRMCSSFQNAYSTNSGPTT